MMTGIDTVVVGAGHAGLAVSRLLTDSAVEHVVLEQGRLAESWRSKRWDSLHLLSPNWMTRLPGWRYDGPDQEGFMPAPGLVRQLESYATSFDAPVLEHTSVERVAALKHDRGKPFRFIVDTDRGTWLARNVVVATGPGVPNRPQWASHSPVPVLTSSEYRNPGQLPAGGVLVVGASASGVQIADELNRSGREVVLAVGRHTRIPRRYRGMDIFWWLERTGRLSRTIDDVVDPVKARRDPSMQLVGRNCPDAGDTEVDLGSLSRRGVRITGRLTALKAGRAGFDDSLGRNVLDAEALLTRMLDDIDGHILAEGLASEVLSPDRPAPVRLPAPVESLDLAAGGVGSILLATGYRPDHSWIHLPVHGVDGHLSQRRGVTSAPGLYVVGQRFQHRRDSAFIDGARHDAGFVVRHLLGEREPAEYLEQGAS